MRHDLLSPALFNPDGSKVSLIDRDGGRRDLHLDGTSKLEDWDGTRVDRDMEGHPIEGFDYEAWFEGRI
jgi:hypothetical protein